MIVVCIVAVVFTAAIAAVGLHARNLDTVYPNLTVDGIDLGGMTLLAAKAALEEVGYSEGLEDVSAEISLPDGSAMLITGEEAGLIFEADNMAKMAIDYGKDGSFISNAMAYLRCRFGGVDIGTGEAAEVNEEYVRGVVSEYVQEFNLKMAEDSYSVNEKEIVIIKGASSAIADEDEVYEITSAALYTSLEELSPVYVTYKIEAESDSIDFNALYNAIYIAPVSAQYDSETYGATESVTGISFDLEAAQRTYDAANVGNMVTIRIIYTKPDVTTEELNDMLFRDVLSEVTTSLASSSYNRINNVTLAAAAVNGVILNPGDEFSFNGTVGQRTVAKGYLPAGAYVGGETVQEVGGGICQMSSSLYYCVLYSNLEVVSRSNHMYTVSYLPLGQDATVNWGTIDFKFANSAEYPVRIDSYVEGKTLTVRFYGTKLDDTYIKVNYEIASTTEFETIEKEDESIADGTTEVDIAGHNGYLVNTYKYLYDADGTIISKTFIARSSYRKQDRVILVPEGSLTGDAGEEDPTSEDDVTEDDVTEDDVTEDDTIEEDVMGEDTPVEGDALSDAT